MSLCLRLYVWVRRNPPPFSVSHMTSVDGNLNFCLTSLPFVVINSGKVWSVRDCFGLLPSGVGFLITLNLQDGLELIYVAVYLALPNGEFLQWWMTTYLTGFLSPAIIFICPPPHWIYKVLWSILPFPWFLFCINCGCKGPAGGQVVWCLLLP